MTDAIKVFISYSHDTTEHEKCVLDLSDRLRDDGIDANIDQYQTNPAEGWQLWMEKQIRDSQFVILVCTETYLKRVMKEDEGRGKGVMWESTIVYSYLYDAGVVNEKFVPVVFSYENTKHIPTPLKPTTFYDASTDEGYESLYRRLTNQPNTTKPELGKLKSLPKKVVVSLAKLPSTSPDLFGREDRLKQLDDVWNNQDINVLSLVAWGGVGKTALVNRWLSNLAKDNYRGAERVFGWSFYSQGAAEGRQVSADQFIAATLTWFGDPDPTAGSPWDKGERLAEYIKKHRTLLILDGLEPLQSPPPVETGKIKDPGLTSLLRELARQNPGLVVISTRLPVDDLKDFIGSTAKEIDLDALSDEAGAEYLKHLGVDGTEEECKQASHDFGGHALALTLLGRYLKVVHGGDIRKRREIPHVMDEQKQGKHARRVMESYEVFLKGKPELDILRLMGLFDRPAEKGALDALRKEPTIKGLTEELQELKDADWKFAVNNLRELRLLAEQDPHEPDTLDCHPLLREHFSEKLKAKNEQAWCEAHGRLYEYYKSFAKEFPDTLQEMAPLFAAVMHGCQAGYYIECALIYYSRILRGYRNAYVVRQLGAIGSNLAVLSNFFEVSWSKTVAVLDDFSSATILGNAGYSLRALARLREAAQAAEVSLSIMKKQENWLQCAIGASNSSELYLIIGDVKQALTYAQESVQFADKSGDEFERLSDRTILAYAQHQAGQLVDALTTFREAEEIQKKRQPEYPLLYSTGGFQYCDLLLSQGNYADVELRANQTLEWAKQGGGGLLSIALETLSLGRALTATPTLSYSQEQRIRDGDALTHLSRAVDGLRQAGQQDMLPFGLIARAEYYRLTNDLVRAKRDLDEAFTIATRGGMGLHLADCHLEYARLYLAKGEKAKAREHWQIAKDSIEKMGYHRRDKEVQELEEQLS